MATDSNNRFSVFLKLVRIRNCLIASFGVLVGALLVAPSPADLGLKAYLAAAAAALITGGGNTLNDYYDMRIDKINRPDRPLPSGKIKKRNALTLAAGLFLLGLGLAKTVNNYCLILAILNSLILVVYAAYSKKMLLVANLGVSYLVASVFIFGALSTIDPTKTLYSEKTSVALILTACAFFMTLSREIIKDIEDIEGDSKMKSKTLPINLGPKKAKNTAILFASAGIILSLTPIAFKFNTLNPLAYGTLIATANLTFISALTKPAQTSQKTMILGMLLSLLAFYLGKTLA